MLFEWVLASIVTVVLCAAIVRLPQSLRKREDRYRSISELSDSFSVSSGAAIKSAESMEVVNFVASLGAMFGKPTLVRRLVLSALTGKLKRQSNHPTASALAFLSEFKRQPKEVRDQVISAMACACLASALESPFLGRIFRNIMVPNPKVQRDSFAAYVPEVERISHFKVPLAA